MVQNDRTAHVNATVDGNPLNLGITFESSGTPDERSGAWTQEGDILHFIFKGWNNPLGTCVLEPTKIGEIQSKKLYFQIAHHYVGEQNLMHLFIYVEE